MRLGRTFLVVGLLALAGCAQLRAWQDDLFGKRAEPPPPVARTEPQPAPRGTLLLAGGGRLPGAVIGEAARLTSGGGRRVLVIPLASTARDPGRTTLDLWTSAGFTDCEVLDAFEAAHAEQQIAAADILWMTGGNESRLLDKLLESNLAEAVRARLAAGAVVGGTNAGAAAVAELVFVGATDDAEMQQGRVETAPGLALWPGVIVDQAFVAKRRFNRLMAAVLDHPQFVGVGIDEGTGVVVTGTTLKVVGEGNVVVIDARRAKVSPTRPGDASAATGVQVDVLADGMTYELAR